MDKRIQQRVEGRRGCGYRNKPGALYLVDLEPANFRPCGKLPIALEVCPVCACGIKPARQWVWVDADKLLAEGRKKPCARESLAEGCPGCMLDDDLPIGRAGLLWVGEKFYSPEEFLGEAGAMGISRRVAFVPGGFKVGETWVLLAHLHAIPGKGQGKATAGVITAFKPKAVEVICDGDESREEIDRYIERGLTPVIVDNPDRAAESGEDEEAL